MRLLKRIDVSSRDNNFYLVRLLLASRVIFGHAFVLAGTVSLASEQSFGRVYNSLGVNGFFVVSGFLVTRSLMSSKSWRDFVAARVLRILPALWAMILIVTPIVVLFGTDPELRSWAQIPSALEYAIRNMLIIPIRYVIEGVFADMPVIGVNGSLWSLRFEVVCYMLLGLLALLRMRHLLIVVPILAVLLYLGLVYALWAGSDDYFILRFLRLGSLFFFGAALALHAHRIWVSVPLSLLFVVLASIGDYLLGTPYLIYLPFGYLLLSIAYSDVGFLKPVRRAAALDRVGSPDLSYGIYLYSFPIQQLLYYHEVTISPYSNIVATILLASLCAYCSSQWVEKPFSALRRTPRRKEVQPV